MSVISHALKELKEKERARLVSKRYLISPTDNLIIADKSGISVGGANTTTQPSITWESNSKRVTLVDMLNGNTSSTYLSLGEAAEAIGCHKTTISKGLKKL